MKRLALCVLSSVLVLSTSAATPHRGPSDVDEALRHVNWAWNNNTPCTRTALCATYFDAWGVDIRFADGSVVPFARLQRLTTSAHDCIAKAREYLGNGDRGMAVQWVMASQIHNEAVRKWMKRHPDAVIGALKRL